MNRLSQGLVSYVHLPHYYKNGDMPSLKLLLGKAVREDLDMAIRNYVAFPT